MSIFKGWFNKDDKPAPPEDDKEEELEIISRDEARAQGYTYYFQGIACANGHLVERYTTSGQCMQCVADANVRHRENAARRVAAQKAAPVSPSKPFRVVSKGALAQALSKHAAKREYAAQNAAAIVKLEVPFAPPPPSQIPLPRPPHSGQWKKGQSGNYNGRPKGSKNNTSAHEHEIQRLKALLFDIQEKGGKNGT